MKKFFLFIFFFLLPILKVYADPGDVTVINTISPKNNAFQFVVRSTNVYVSTASFGNNLTSADYNLQHALETINNLSISSSSSGGGGITTISTMTAGATNFILNTQGLQVGASFSVSSGSITGPLTINSTSTYSRGIVFQSSSGVTNMYFDQDGTAYNTYILKANNDILPAHVMRSHIGSGSYISAGRRFVYQLGYTASNYCDAAGIDFIRGSNGGKLEFYTGGNENCLGMNKVLTMGEFGNAIFGNLTIASSGFPQINMGNSNYTSTARLQINAWNSHTGLVMQGDYYSLGTNIMELQVGGDGSGTVKGMIDGYYRWAIGSNSILGQFSSTSLDPSYITSVFRGAASQSANLTEWQNSSGVILASVTASGLANFPAIYVGTITITKSLVAAGSAGTSGQILQSNGPNASPSWVTSSGGGGGPTTISTITAGATNFIFNRNTLQAGSTFYVSSGTVAGNLRAGFFYGDGSNLTNLPATSPAGSNTQVQFNNSGSFGADSNLTFNGNFLNSNWGYTYGPSGAYGYFYGLSSADVYIGTGIGTPIQISNRASKLSLLIGTDTVSGRLSAVGDTSPAAALYSVDGSTNPALRIHASSSTSATSNVMEMWHPNVNTGPILGIRNYGQFFLNSSSATVELTISAPAGQTQNVIETTLVTGSNNPQFAVGSTGNLRVRGVQYSWPSTQGAASTVLQNDGSGNLSWASVSGGGGISTISTMTAGATNFIFNQNTLQSGATFYVSSGSVAGIFEVNGQTYIKSTDVNKSPLIIRGTSGQTANLTEWQNQVGGVFAYIDNGGRLVANGQYITFLDAANLAYNQASPARLGTGTPDSSKILRGDGVWTSTVTFLHASTVNVTSNLLLNNSPGAQNQFLMSNGPGLPPSWSTTITSTFTTGSIILSTATDHIIISTSPSVSVTSCGTGATVSGGDTMGQITVGSAPSLTTCILNFARAFNYEPTCLLFSRSNNTLIAGYTPGTASITINGTNLGGHTINYFCADRR